MLDPIYKMGNPVYKDGSASTKCTMHVKANINTLKENQDKDIKAFI
jgi:hypothetical protein